MTSPLKVRHLTSALALGLFAAATSASNEVFDIAFTQPPVLDGTREVWVQPGHSYSLNLFSQQNDYCFASDGADPSVSCPEVAALSFAQTPPGSEACFTQLGGGCTATSAVAPGQNAEVILEILPSAAFSPSALRVNALGGSDSASGQTMVKIAPALFAPPATVKVFRGGAANLVALPFARPINLSKPVDVTLVGESSGISAGFSPATLSGGASSTTMSIAATGTAPLGDHPVAIGAMVIGAFVEPTQLVYPFVLTVADALTPIFPTDVQIARPLKYRSVTRSIAISATVDPDLASTGTMQFALTGCNCSVMKSQIALNGATLVVEVAPGTGPSGILNIGMRATLGVHTHDFIVPIKITGLVAPSF